MKKYIIQMINNYSSEVLDTIEEEYDTYEEAEEYSIICSSNYSAEAEILKLAGRSFNHE